jgi:hypothetical protein
MSDLISNAYNSEYNNIGDLMGIDEALLGEINEAMEGLGAVDKLKFMKRLGSGTFGSRGSRAEFEKFFKEVPKDVRHSLIKGDLRLSDYVVYSIKHVNSKTIKLFESQDDKEVGLRNISNAKLPKNFVFIVSGIYMLAGVAQDVDDKNKLKATDFKSIINFPSLANAEFSLKANKKQIIPEGNVVRKFISDTDHTRPLGYFKLDNPRLIRDDEAIEFTIELGSQLDLDPKLVVYVGLDGTITTP